MTNLVFITVKHQFEGVHRYPEAPEEVRYLRDNHRHTFHVEVEIEVFTDDRELEFIMVKHVLQAYTDSSKDIESNVVVLGTNSCEMIAQDLQTHIKKLYPLPKTINPLMRPYFDVSRAERIVNVRVSEDGENGVYLLEV